jgi:adenine-specific DNA glycosylase
LPERHALLLLLRDAQDRVLLRRRPPAGVWAGLWSLPEADDHAAARTWFETHIAGDYDAADALAPIDQGFTHYRFAMQPLEWREVASRDGGRVLLVRRPPTGVWSGMWSLPEVADHDEAREFIAAHSDADFEDNVPLALIEHTFSHYRLHIAPLLWRAATPPARIGDNPGQRWQSLDALDEVGLPAPVRKLLLSLR